MRHLVHGNAMGKVNAANLNSDRFRRGLINLFARQGSHPDIYARAGNSARRIRRLLMEDTPPARVLLSDQSYNVKISGHVTGGAHRKFVMASGEITKKQFLSLNDWLDGHRPLPRVRWWRLGDLH